MKQVTYLTTEEMASKHHHLAGEGITVLGTAADGALVGYVEFLDDGDNETKVEMIWVNKDCRGKGYSTLLLEKMLEMMPGTLAITGDSMHDSLAFWQHKGVSFHPDAFQQDIPELPVDLRDDPYEGILYAFAWTLNNESGYKPYWEN